jgi:alpha-glucosidase
MLALPGGAYVYQGEELGLPEVIDLPDEVRQDPTFFRTGGAERGRDGCRVPLPWSGGTPPFGFGPADSHPWLPQPAEWAELTVEHQAKDPNSMLSLYRKALRLRHELPALGDGPMDWLEGFGTNALAFHREPDFTCLVNLGRRSLSVPADIEVLLSSIRLESPNILPSDAAMWYRSSR